MFTPTSRYWGLETAAIDIDGVGVAYVRRRFLPNPDSLPLLTTHEVTRLDRLDRVAASYLGDPELFWRVVDGNRTLDPDDVLRTIGRRIRITLPQGMGGTSDDL